MRTRKILKRMIYMCGCSILLLNGCGKTTSISESTNSIQETGEVVFGASEMYETYSVSDLGILYGRDNRIQYYDCKANEEYILCSKLNCSHSDEECSAWYPSYGMAGIAHYKDKIWYIKEIATKNTWELTSMDVSGEGQQVRASLEIGDVVDDSWIIQSIHDVYYVDDKAIVSVEYGYVSGEMDEIDSIDNTKKIQYEVIDLTNGKISIVNEIGCDTKEYNLLGLSKDGLLFKVRENQIKELTEKEFQEAYLAGEFSKDTISAEDEDERYFEYISKWYPANCSPVERYLYYDLETGESVVLEEMEATLTFDDDGYQIGELQKYIFLGIYDDRFLISEPEWNDTNERIFLWDVRSGEKEEVMIIENGGVLAFESGEAASVVDNEGKFLFCKYEADDKAVIYQYDIGAKTQKKLFEDKRNITFRIIGETQTEYIGKIYTDFGYSIYRISKEDYYSGEMKQMKKLKL